MKENRVLFVTGASSDIGEEIIRSVAQNYDKIVTHYNNSKEHIEKLQEEFADKIIPIQADFANVGCVDDMIQSMMAQGHYPEHIVHLAAPKAFYKKFHMMQWDEFEQGISISLCPIVKILQAFLPAMIKNKRGKIIFMLTSATLNQPPKYQSSYVTVKYALMGLMKSLAVEYADKGITVNGVSPDMVKTKFLSDIPQFTIKQYEETTPKKRILSVEDVVPAFSFLLSEQADNVTGLNLSITGGR